MIETRFGILIRHPDGTKRKFGQVSRSDKGDVYANWTVHEPPFKPGVPEWNPHGSYHASGQVHSKSHNRIGLKKNRQVPGPAFVGAEPLEAINADRALLMSLPVVAETFDDTFEIDVSLITGSPKQSITVDLVEPNADPVRLTGNDIVIAEKTFSDKVPWIVVSLVDPPDSAFLNRGMRLARSLGQGKNRMSDKPMIRCPHCAEHIEAERLLPQRKYRNEFGLDVFECPECHQNFKFEPSEYLGIREHIEKSEVPEGVAIEGAKLDDLLPSEKMAVDYDRKPRAMNRRAVPLIMGIVAIGLAAWIIFSFDRWWTFVVAVLLLAFGWPSLKTAFSASDKEVDELTGKRPMSEETKRKFKDRV